MMIQLLRQFNTVVNAKSGLTVGEAEHKAGIVMYGSKTSWLRKQHELRDELKTHKAQVLFTLASIISKNYITVTTEKVDGWSKPIPVLTMKKIEKKIIPKLKSLKFEFNGWEDCSHPEFIAFLKGLMNLNFVKVQYGDLSKLPAGYDIDKLEVKLAHPLFTEEHVANIIQGDIQKNPRWVGNATITCKPFPKKEDVINDITYPLQPYVGKGKKRKQVYAPCRVQGCPSFNQGGKAKGFCRAHFLIHDEKFESTKALAWGRIRED